MTQNGGDNQLIHNGTVAGRVPGAPDFLVVTDGTYTVHVFDTQGTMQEGDYISIYKQNSTYYAGQKLK